MIIFTIQNVSIKFSSAIGVLGFTIWFTIQNVPIKFLVHFLEFGAFPLFTIQNVPIKYSPKHYELNGLNDLQYKMFLLNDIGQYG